MDYRHAGLSSCSARGQLLHSMWDLLRPRIELVSPALAGRFLTPGPPGKFESDVFDFSMVIYHCVILTFPCLILEEMSFRSQQVFRILSTDEQKVLWLLFWGVATGWQDFLMPKAVSKLSLWNQESLMAEKV